MKTKRIVLAVMVLSAIVLFGTIANAQVTWYDCTVERVGKDWVELTDTLGTFSNKWFIIPSTQKKEIMAMGLTAISLGLPLHVRLDPANYLSLVECYLIKPSAQ